MVTPYHTKLKYDSVAPLLGYNQVFFHQVVLDFLLIYCLHILSISVMSDLFSFCLFDLILYVHSTIFQLCGTVFLG